MEELTYGVEDITVLEGLEAVRRRPGMYVGSTGSRGLHHLIYEVVDNSIDEALAGCCTKIEVTIHPDNYVTVIDNGRGIPVDIHHATGISAVEVVLTKLHAGAKFGSKGYKVSGGLHGVGVSVVNALSERLEIEVKREGSIHKQSYCRGEPDFPVKKIGKCKGTGTKITFIPDKEIFEDIEFNTDIIVSHLREMAFLNKDLEIRLKDERSGPPLEEVFKYKGGITDFVKHLNKMKGPLHKRIVYFNKDEDETSVEIAMQYNTGYTESIYAFANTINTEEGGTHLVGFKSALTRVLNDYTREKGLLKEKEDNLVGEDVREGLTAIISLKLVEPQFEGQTKTKLGNPEVRGIVESIVGEKLAEFLEEHPSEARLIVNKAINSSKARTAARKARELTRRKSFLESSSLPGKLADCSLNDPEKCEIYIVEGDSAGGSAKQARDRSFQAILPLKGKILNVEKSRLSKILTNDELQAIITALGTGIEEDFDINKARYQRIIIMTDADVDGAHIRTLILTFFYRYMKPLIEAGYIYIAQPPLYKLSENKNEKYVYSEKELKSVLKGIEGKRYNLQRFKGLGEMNPEQLWETTMDPDKRILLQITVEDAVLADEIFTTLMGDKVEPRREFIQKYAREVRFLDI